MIFIILAAITLIVSFIIAFLSLVREQKKAHELAEQVQKPELNRDHVLKTNTFPKQQDYMVPLAEKPAGDLQHGEFVHEPFPWQSEGVPKKEEPVLPSVDRSQPKILVEKGTQNLSGEVSIKDLGTRSGADD